MKAQLALFRKNLTRFWPLLLGYCAVLLFAGLVQRERELLPWYYINMLNHITALVYGFLCAAFLFGDLFNKARCNALHAMPITRLGIYSVHFVTGLLFFLIPTGLLFLVTGNHYADSFLKLCLHFMLCYGLALLCVMLAGNRIGAVVMYLCFYILPSVLSWFYAKLYQPYLPSVGIPEASNTGSDFIFYIEQRIPNDLYNAELQSFLYLGLLGVAFALAAAVLYRFRKPERTGQFSVVAWVPYVFCSLTALVGGVLILSLLRHLPKDDWTLFLCVPLAYFAAAMLADKRFFVFRPGHLLTIGILTAVFFNSIWIVRYDALGILDYVPDSKSVKSVDVFVDENHIVGLEDRYYDYAFFQEDGIRVIDPDDIETITQIHKNLLKNAAFKGKHRMIYLTYNLKNGLKVRRYYSTYPGEHYEDVYALEAAVSTRSALFGDLDWETYPDQVYYIGVSNTEEFRRLHFCAPEELPDTDPMDVIIHREDMRRRMLQALKNACDRGELNPLERSEYIVIIKSRDHRGREKTVELSLPDGLAYIDQCWKQGSKCPNRTITEE